MEPFYEWSCGWDQPASTHTVSVPGNSTGNGISGGPLVGWTWHKSGRRSGPVKRLIMLYITIIYIMYACVSVCILLKLNQAEVNLNRLITPIFFKWFHKMEKRGTFFSFLNKSTITLILTSENQQPKYKKENYRPKSLMNIYVKFLIKV